MNALALRALIETDTRGIVRDPLLGWMLLLPLALGLVIRLVVPRLEVSLLASTGFDLTPYHPLIMGGYLMTAPGMIGMVVGFLLLDERDGRTLAALRVTPFTMRRYLAYRTALPLLVGTLATLVGYPLAGISPLAWPDLAAIAAVAGLSAPILALVLATAAPNKVAGFALVKVLNTVNLIPIAAFFVPRPVQLAAGVLPTYWPMRALWSAASGEPYAIYAIAGVFVAGLALLVSAGLFERRLRLRG